MVCHFKKDTHLYAVHQPFNGLGICSNRLKLSIQKKVPALQTVLAMPLKTKLQPFEQVELSVQKKNNNNYYCWPVRTAGATCLKEDFSQVSTPKQFCCQPSHLLCYLSGHIVNFVYYSIIAIFAFIISIDSIDMFYSTLHFFSASFVKIMF